MKYIFLFLVMFLCGGTLCRAEESFHEGLNEILDRFGSTTPGVDNIVEWKTITDNIALSANHTDDQRFLEFVTVLSTIKPGNANKNEWAAIRATCFSIIGQWNKDSEEYRFKKLLFQFMDTHPQSANKVEWHRIRETSEHILEEHHHDTSCQQKVKD